MSEWIDCPKCGENHENLCVCPEPSVRQPEEEKVVSDTPRTDAIIGQREFGSLPDSEYCALARTLERELVARTIERDALHGTVMKLILDAEKWHAVARELSMALGNDGVETNNDLSELARNNALASFNAMEKGQT